MMMVDDAVQGAMTNSIITLSSQCTCEQRLFDRRIYLFIATVFPAIELFALNCVANACSSDFGFCYILVFRKKKLQYGSVFCAS